MQLEKVKNKILVIEDEPTVLENIIELLSTFDYHVKGAGNGIEGIEIAKVFLPDLIICDIMMPDLDGYGVLKSLQESKDTSAIPFIFLTAKSAPTDIRFGMELGADDYLTKPFMPEELFKSVKARLKKAQALTTITESKLEELRMNIASSLPHELRTPLNGIIAASQLLLDYDESLSKDEVKQLHVNIYNSSLRLNDLVRRHLIYTDLELIASNKSNEEILKSKCILLNPSVIITSVFNKTAEEFSRQEDLFFELDKRINIVFSPEHFQIICEELATNAFKFSEKGEPVIVKCFENNGKLVLSVKDEGRGMSDLQIVDIGAFKQFDRDYYEQQGMGLGLVIIKKIAQIYKSVIDIHSKLGSHTNVVLNIPMKLTD